MCRDGWTARANALSVRNPGYPAPARSRRRRRRPSTTSSVRPIPTIPTAMSALRRTMRVVAAKTLVPSVRTRTSSPSPRNCSSGRPQESTLPRWRGPSLLCFTILPSVRTRISTSAPGRGEAADRGAMVIARSKPPSAVSRKVQSRRRRGALHRAVTESNRTSASTSPGRPASVRTTVSPSAESSRERASEASPGVPSRSRSAERRMTERPDPSRASRWCSSHAAGAHPRPAARISAAPAHP